MFFDSDKPELSKLMEQTTGVEARELLRLWLGFLAAPVAWALQLQTTYALVPKACDDHTLAPLHVSSAVFLAVAVAGLWIAWRNWQLVGQGWPSAEEGGSASRARFMAVLGMLSSSLFVLLIVAQWIPVLFIDPCFF